MKPNKPKHIVHLIYRLDIGGLERVMVNCINAMPPTQYKHSIIALTDYSDEFVKLIERDVDLYSIKKPEGHSWKAFWLVFKQLWKLKADVLHSYNLPTLEYQICGLIAGIPKRIHAEHGRDIYDPEGNNKKYQKLRQIISPFLDKFVCVSDDLYSWLMQTVNIAPSKCQLIYNGVDTEKYQVSDRKSVLDESQQDKFVFGCVGRLQAIKDHQLLIRAFTLACEQDTSFANCTQLSLIGDGPLRTQLEQQVQIADTQFNIWFAGARHDMANVYHSFDVFVMSSLGEGIPMTMLEAMSTGLPVVSTNVGGISEIVSEHTAILVPPAQANLLANAMLKIFYQSKTEDFQQMKITARKDVVENFSEQSMVSSYQRIYK
ncbi:TIGR03088 family PEP-CTERM/XrtA system glycosyltransferase [Catenovulum adriaticum]|uniref:TIGR03088 family PEP-CTERM/XrtA system glycosyltransferase n=1 Tax=Catenovulum adriaticum TaxID=2984846 RepID=A0ABY7AQG0_9ALTE|nr:TIGR03088 family PEP-CTERM/XrtA system glycosyltransferase [Catenovulum sp. TS8]WAJ70705.1 TIGR03088 family PEP-CTERM/XrtA system glycosyltransferase [Catenovulum sp. TS8]